MKHVLVIKNNINEIGKLPEFIDLIAQEQALGMKLVMNLNLVIEEAVSNIIQYAYTNGQQEEITIEADMQNQNLIFTITDHGKPFDPTQVDSANIELEAQQRPIGGLGIFLIKKIMNTVEYQRIDGTNVFTLSKTIE